MTDVPMLPMNTGAPIPQLGFGVFQIDPDETRAAVRAAFEVGYRHIDTAQMYRNEAGVGEAFRDSGLDRAEVFITTKLNNNAHDHEVVPDAFDRSLEELAMDHVDLFLIHWPMPDVGDYLETWRAMEEVHASGRAKAIGVSNFGVHHLQRLLDAGATVPAVNQIEAHPWLPQNELRAFGSGHGILTEAWSPIARGRILDDAAVVEVAERHGRTPAQVVLRWHIERGDVVFPKTVHRDRLEENFALFGFSLDGSDMAAIDMLDRGERLGPDPDTFNAVP